MFIKNALLFQKVICKNIKNFKEICSSNIFFEFKLNSKSETILVYFKTCYIFTKKKQKKHQQYVVQMYNIYNVQTK